MGAGGVIHIGFLSTQKTLSLNREVYAYKRLINRDGPYLFPGYPERGSRHGPRVSLFLIVVAEGGGIMSCGWEKSAEWKSETKRVVGRSDCRFRIVD